MQVVVSGQEEPVDGKGPKAAQANLAAADRATPWYAVWTHSHCEQLVYDQLSAKGFELFFPKTAPPKGRLGRRRPAPKALLPGYVFLRRDLDKTSYIEVIKARGVVRVLGERWDALTPIPDVEIEAIRRVLESGARVTQHPHLNHGDRVRIVEGPLAGISGIFLRSKPGKGLLVLSVELLQRSVALEVPLALVEVA